MEEKKEEQDAAEWKEEQDAAEQKEEHERSAIREGSRSRNERKNQPDGSAEESLKEGVQGKPNANEINKPQFRDSAARLVPGGTWLAQSIWRLLTS
ncbi:hypothetical protein NDU88_005804 [Pleurodeles waltl]|uniref:Uncharacterized protein n=1 Tax=Pleurodeles waltl TaxID=8319 RepID=A0AAV7VMZ7_PLEWA|nr:hypothetical protein NDU88_005804 [Pleurodeles waltl]